MLKYYLNHIKQYQILSICVYLGDSFETKFWFLVDVLARFLYWSNVLKSKFSLICLLSKYTNSFSLSHIFPEIRTN